MREHVRQKANEMVMKQYKGLSGYKVRYLFAWYDLWIGVFIDRKKDTIYIFLIPMLGVVIEPKYPKFWNHGK